MLRLALPLGLSLLVAGCAVGVDDEPVGHAADRAVERDLDWAAREGTETTAAARPLGSGDLGVYQEAEACSAIFDAYMDRGLQIGCAVTAPVCPGLLQQPFGECLQYDPTTVEDCVERIESSTSCDQLWTLTCDVRPIVDSQPLGCDLP